MDFIVKDLKDNDFDLNQYKGKVILIVNTATACGFTKQYEDLERIYKKYKEEGFEILDFPCNQFGNQAKGTNEEINSFCKGRFGITFKQFGKVEVNGENAEPLFKYLKEQTKDQNKKDIGWNFTKFLVDKNGNVVKRFAPTVSLKKVEEEITKLI